MKKIEINLYSIDELSKKAQKNAYNSWLSDYYYPFGPENKQTLDTFKQIFGVNVKHYNRSVLDFAFCAFDRPIPETGERLAKWIYNNYKECLYKNKYYYLKTYNKKRKSKIFKNKDCVLTGYYLDNVILGPIYDFIERPDREKLYSDIIKECLDNYYKAIEDDYNFYTSFESFKEECYESDYLFFKEGIKYEN